MRARSVAVTTLSCSLLAFSLASPARPQAAATAPAKPAVIKPADNLVTDGIPDIPAEIAETVGRYTEFRSASLAGWHPVKREMLITTRFGDTPQVHEVRIAGGARRQLTFFPDRVGGRAGPAARPTTFSSARTAAATSSARSSASTSPPAPSR